MKTWVGTLVRAGRKWSNDNAFQHSAAVSFYTMFSLAPITIIATAIAGFFLGSDKADKLFNKQVTDLVGRQSAEMIHQAAAASLSHKGNMISAIVGIVIMLVGATTVFGQLQESLNQIWGVKANPKRSGIVLMLLRRLISFAMVLTIGFLLLVSLIVSTAITAFMDSFHGASTVPPVAARIVDMGVSLVVISALFALCFKVLPDVQLRWRDVWGGAVLTAALFGVGRFLIALYLGHSTVASIYGAAGSLVALLMWVYYSSAIMFYGVEVTQASRQAHGPPVQPKITAVFRDEDRRDAEKHEELARSGTAENPSG